METEHEYLGVLGNCNMHWGPRIVCLSSVHEKNTPGNASDALETRQLLLTGISAVSISVHYVYSLTTFYKLMDFLTQQKKIFIGKSALICAELQVLFLSELWLSSLLWNSFGVNYLFLRRQMCQFFISPVFHMTSQTNSNHKELVWTVRKSG